MRILYAHNFYRLPGGEDQTFADEICLMRSRGHDVATFETSSRDQEGRSRLALGLEGVWSVRHARAMAERLRAERPDVVHVHNTYPVTSPALFRAIAGEGVAVVHTLHNFRILCSHYGLTRDGRPCEDCVGAVTPWRGVVRGCNQNGRLADAQIAVAVLVHRAARTWTRAIDRYVALTPFARDIFVRGGLPADRMAVLPTFVDPDPGTGPGDGGFALFVGRLAPEKGVRVLLDAWRTVGARMPLHIVGSGGPLAPEAAAADGAIPGVRFRGRVERDELTGLMRRAAVLVFPSTWYEGTPRTIVEAFAAGTPVLASDIGSMRSMVEPEVNGQWFRAGDPADLARVVTALAAAPDRLAALRGGARRSFETLYTAERHYAGLEAIYRAAIARRAGESARLPGAAQEARP